MPVKKSKGEGRKQAAGGAWLQQAGGAAGQGAVA